MTEGIESALVIDETLAGERLDVAAAHCAGVTRSRAGKLIDDGLVTLNGVVCAKPSCRVSAGDTVRAILPPAAPARAQAQDIDIEVVYQDDDLAVVYKPSGMVVHPAAGNPDGTLVNALLAKLDRLSGIGGELRPGIVHRIDKDTSGLLLVAKNDFAHAALAEQIKVHSVQRAYLAIVQGHMKEASGTVDAPIGRHRTDRKKMAIVPDGREAVTHYVVLEQLRGADLVRCVLSTGRTHQIRVHMASLNHPLLGDPLYGGRRPAVDVPGGQLLHAFRLGFVHPRSGRALLFEAPPEPRFELWLKKLRNS